MSREQLAAGSPTKIHLPATAFNTTCIILTTNTHTVSQSLLKKTNKIAKLKKRILLHDANNLKCTNAQKKEKRHKKLLNLNIVRTHNIQNTN